MIQKFHVRAGGTDAKIVSRIGTFGGALRAAAKIAAKSDLSSVSIWQDGDNGYECLADVVIYKRPDGDRHA